MVEGGGVKRQAQHEMCVTWLTATRMSLLFISIYVSIAISLYLCVEVPIYRSMGVCVCVCVNCKLVLVSMLFSVAFIWGVARSTWHTNATRRILISYFSTLPERER